VLPTRRTVVLASASPARARLLAAAGVAFETVPSGIDEVAVVGALGDAPLEPADVAMVLAETKASAVAEGRAGAVVIGADQVLELDGAMLDKPEDLAAARRQLLSLRGRRHRLTSAAVCVAQGSATWRCARHADITMRDYSPAFVGHYLAAIGGRATDSVGAYEIEGPGAQLFGAISGDHFVVQGLPLLELLAHLRELGALET